ncbi:MAG: hypothetical protein COU69_02850 [Candidatus Pacebacteria bacterium CG10_big_fil_rev_8_21_14_0_10_56_10]|nr:MAG: hypothetical protein COU69_02850 [Candidatus Pacebacteria bacterium CG10_big_fil_rev_8_21_14_0_10_56_10]
MTDTQADTQADAQAGTEADTRLLVGSLSNDLLRVASLAQRGSTQAASRFLGEAQRWSRELQQRDVAEYVVKLARDISARQADDISMPSAERYLMYGVLLQNYALHRS